MPTGTETLKMTSCRVDTGSITVFFSGAVDTSGDSASAANGANYTVFAPNSGFNQMPLTGWTPTPLPDGQAVRFVPPTGFTSPAFAPGDWVHISITQGNSIGPQNSASGQTSITSGSVSGRVPGDISQRQVRDVEDAISYPVLTEEVSYRPSSPVGIGTTGAGGISGPGGSNIGQIAMQAVTDVLGWKVNPADPKGFLGALTQSFTLKDVEGHTESSWVPRTYAVQTDLGGGITGAQASLYMRAKDALDQSLSLLDGLYPLDPDADPEYVRALREMARSQMTEIVKELGVVGLPSILRINTYFNILLEQDMSENPPAGVQLNPDLIGGTLGEIRKIYGIYFKGNPYNNSVEDEQDITNFRVISDYMTSLCQSWIENRRFFRVESGQPAFFGTQLVLISRQFNVIAETVSEVRFALDSVFIGPNERQTLLLKFPKPSRFPSMYLEDVLDEVGSFVSEEGPRLLRDGGKISVRNNIRPVVEELRDMIRETRDQTDPDVPKGFYTARVKRAMDDLHNQLDQLLKLTEQVEQKLPIPMYALTIRDIVASASQIDSGSGDLVNNVTLSFLGSAIDPKAKVHIHSGNVLTFEPVFYSAERIDVSFDPDESSALQNGEHIVTINNQHNGEVARRTFTYNWDPTPSPPQVKVKLVSENGGSGENSAEDSSQEQLIPVAERVWTSAKSEKKTPKMAPASQTAQQLKGLQQQVTDLKASQTTLSQNIEDMKKTMTDSLANHLTESNKNHESFKEEMKGWLAKMKSSSEAKKSGDETK